MFQIRIRTFFSHDEEATNKDPNMSLFQNTDLAALIFEQALGSINGRPVQKM